MFEEIKERNSYMLNELFKKYDIDKSLDSIIKYYDSIFVFEEYIKENGFNSELKRAILYANIKLSFTNGKLEKTNKKEILFNFGKKAMKGLSSREINLSLAELHLISHLIRQLKLVSRIEIEEMYVNSILNEV
jgi:hypothetical protein